MEAVVPIRDSPLVARIDGGLPRTTGSIIPAAPGFLYELVDFLALLLGMGSAAMYTPIEF